MTDFMHHGQEPASYPETEPRTDPDFAMLRAQALDRVPEQQRSNTVVIPGEDGKGPQVLDISKLDRKNRQLITAKALATEDQDHEQLLTGMQERMKRAGLTLPAVEVRFENLGVEAGVFVGSRNLPTVLNSSRNFFEGYLIKLGLLRSIKRKFVILEHLSGALVPGRMCLLLGPPGSGKSMLLQTLAGVNRHDSDLKMSGGITYNGHQLNEFVVERTSGYVDQQDTHLAELTVRETFNFSARCQGSGSKADELKALLEAEKKGGKPPDWHLDAFMKAYTLEGKGEAIATEYILRILGLDVCQDTPVGSDMIRGISGGQKRRVTSGEMLVGPRKTLFMDEISSGLDSSTTYQIVKAMRDFTHLAQATILMSLLQPAPEVYDLFDDVMLLSEGQLAFSGPREAVVPFFLAMGFRCPLRKAVPDFLQEVTSRRDQQQYWTGDKRWKFVPVEAFVSSLAQSPAGQASARHLSVPFDRDAPGAKTSLAHQQYHMRGMAAFKALMNRETVLTQRLAFVFVFKAVQSALVAIIVATMFLRTHIHPNNQRDASFLSGFTFFSLLQTFFSGIAEMTFSIERLPSFFKQRDSRFFPVWAYVLPVTVVRLPISFIETLIWTVLTYFEVDLAPDPGRFFMYWFILFLLHAMAVTLFRAIGHLARSIVVANAVGSLSLLAIMMMGGFVLTKSQIHPWTVWVFWIDPLQWAQRALLINEFTDGRWDRLPATGYAPGTTLGQAQLIQRNFPNQYWWVWVSVGALVIANVVFHLLILLGAKYLGPYETMTASMSEESMKERSFALHGTAGDADTGVSIDLNEAEEQGRQARSRRNLALAEAGKSLRNLQASQKVMASHKAPQSSRKALEAHATPAEAENGHNHPSAVHPTGEEELKGNSFRDPDVKTGMVLPFQQMTMTFHDIHYFVKCPPEMANSGLPTVGQKNGKTMLELLRGINGAFRPGVLTCLMGVSGAGKTTLMDVLSGRKTSGVIEGDVRINGHPKVHATFARVSGYCEQFDIHSPQTTVHEALLFSAELRFDKGVTKTVIHAFVEEVMDLVELQTMRDALVGKPGLSGLSVERRKRLTIAVELVANPSIVFMDEPTSGLDARAAAIVMRTVRNIVNTGRTIVATIHQPSIDVFESFDEMLLLKRGGQTIYAGPLGKDSASLIAYFEGVHGVHPIPDGLNPSVWMLEVTMPGNEDRLGVDFADIYANSDLSKYTSSTIARHEVPDKEVPPLAFETLYARSTWEQYLICCRKFNITYWRTPEYNSTRFWFGLAVGLIFGAVFWKRGNKVDTEQNVYNTLGALLTSTLFMGILNSIFVQPVVGAERTVFYRERAAGMYSVAPWYLAMATMEAMYLVGQTVLYTGVLYFMAYFAVDAGKFFWFMLFSFLNFLFFTYFGIACVALTPNLMVAAILSGAFYGLFNLFAGFVLPRPNIPGWYLWAYYLNPVTWSVYGLVVSNVGDYDNEVQLSAGGTKNMQAFLKDTFDYEHDMVGYIVLILIGFVAVFWGLGAFAFQRLNFQQR